ncbi:MAG: UTP--glucose-1-phosphate uridylyltransferase [Dehalococcoidia bacterium]|nr:UTP--glucose-1-phosphate uridylyltransferase [Bacillota bacterium]
MLEYIVCHLARHGFDQIAINLHFMPEAIQDYFRDGSWLGVELVYSYEPQLLGTAGGVKKMGDFLGAGEAFMVHYGDVLTDQDFTAMLHFHRERNALVTLLLHQRARSNSIVSLDKEGRIIGFLERPTEEARRGVKSPWVNSGICICAPQLLDEIPADVACDLPRDIFPRLIDSGRLFGFALSGYRCAVDSPDRLAEARSALAEGSCRISLPEEDAI